MFYHKTVVAVNAPSVRVTEGVPINNTLSNYCNYSWNYLSTCRKRSAPPDVGLGLLLLACPLEPCVRAVRVCAVRVLCVCAMAGQINESMSGVHASPTSRNQCPTGVEESRRCSFRGRNPAPCKRKKHRNPAPCKRKKHSIFFC